MPPLASAPPVVAVVVTCNPGPWFDEALLALASQDYPNLSVLVIDAGAGEDPTERVTTVLPAAFVRRTESRTPYGRAANEVLGVVEGASHYLLCHDDVAPSPDAVRLMVEEAFRSNAGVVTPKLVEWARPDRLLAVGAGADRVGSVHPLVDSGELDQEQHDAVRDVFVAPGGATLVRADLFAALGGYDATVDSFGEDLDLSWRAQLAGARVLVVPAARVRHLAAHGGGHRDGALSELDRRREHLLAESHRLRTVLSCYGWFTLLRIIPLLVAYAVAEAAWELVRGKPGDAAGTLGALGRALGQPRQLWRSRHRVQKQRSVPDREVRRLQSRGNARLRAFVRSRVEEGPAAGIPVAPLDDHGADATAFHGPAGLPEPSVPGRPPAAAPGGQRTAPGEPGRRRGLRPSRPQPAADDRMDPAGIGRGSWQLPLGVALLLLVLVGVGSRNLLTNALPAVGQLPVTSSGVASFWHAWWSTWQTGGLGVSAPSAPGLALLGLAGLVTLGSTSVLAHVLVLGPLIVGPWGAWRAARWWGSQRGRVAAMVVYATVPVPYDALARGRWAGLVVYAAAPWVLVRLCRLGADLPYPTVSGRRTVGRVIGLGVGVAVVAAFAPSFLLVVPVIGVALLLGSVVAGRPGPGLRLLAVAVAGAVAGAVLLLPWSAQVVTSGVNLFGVSPGPADRLGLGEVLRLHTGPVGTGPLGWALLAAAALPLLIGRSWRLTWAARLWLVALACIGLTWSGLRGWTPAPPPEVLLAPAAAALAGAVALGAVAFELDLPGYRFGWRQLASALAAVAVVVAAVPVVSSTGGGRWHLPDGDATTAVGFLPGSSDGDYRILWVGSPGALPLASRRLADGVGYATSFDGEPDVRDTWLAGRAGNDGLLAADLRSIEAGLTTQAGHLLAPFSVRYVIVPNHDGPTGSGADPVPVPAALMTGLADQADLEPVSQDPNYSVYANAAWAPVRSVLTGAAAASATARSAPGAVAAQRAAQAADLAGARPVLTGGSGTGSHGPVPGASTLYVAASRSGDWRLSVAGHALRPVPAFGWALAFTVPAGAGGTALLGVGTDAALRAGQLVGAGLWILAIGAVIIDGRRRRASTVTETVRPEWFQPLATGTGRDHRSGGSRSGLLSGDDDLGSDELWIDD